MFIGIAPHTPRPSVRDVTIYYNLGQATGGMQVDMMRGRQVDGVRQMLVHEMLGAAA